ncbi:MULTISPECIES: MetQ/NlpA family ABC transporter substrate-binding protein [Caproicibacterium]|jgi:D-methionine transport system substrate-binding protein|uniref:Metal ABC transporter substrate-binding protein n=1 Tax=Caproicibacterium lactatifermentans TaxID=2666138 RepID=A0ABX6PW19_9FIRM|nr:MetQ/NlpA family ABC transporter substrate-binding protein [Caproicibacterium lactatifermentans]QKO30307.1 metal ABC transporter substrate-binding protein [Caproicibacterium lactatifermentans]
MKKDFIIRKITALGLAALFASVSLTGCGETAFSSSGSTASTAQAKKELKFSKSQGPYSELFQKGVQPILEKKGYKINAVDMSDLSQADSALNDGEVDFNVEQHVAYMNNFNKTQNGHLAAVTPIPTVPAGIYSGSKTALKQLTDGSKIAVPNDAANTARAYVLLQKAGWIKLKAGIEPTKATQEDIAENPYHIQFVEMKSLNIPSVRSDFDFIVITGSIVYNAKIDPSTALLEEDILPDLMLHLVVKDSDENSQWAKDIAAAYQSDEFKTYLDKNNNGLWTVPDYSKK